MNWRKGAGWTSLAPGARLAYARPVSTDIQQMPPAELTRYEPRRAEFIAEQVATGYIVDPATGRRRACSLSMLHDLWPDVVPHPVVVRRWAEQIPAFKMMLDAALRAQAECLVYGALDSASDPGLQAASARNVIDASWRLAEKLDPARFGNATTLTVRRGDDAASQAVPLTDQELLAIASGGREGVLIEGESRDVTPPAPPLSEREAGARGR